MYFCLINILISNPNALPKRIHFTLPFPYFGRALYVIVYRGLLFEGRYVLLALSTG
uniref:Uncharacterized protein n=1 Tax=Anguilla anguilla TaxID=7936 RepID=A0A0E9Q8K9_ANGAN